MLALVTASTFEPISLQRAKANCHVADGDKSHDDFLIGAIKEARDYIEKSLGCVLCQSTWRQTLDEFPNGTSGTREEYRYRVLRRPLPIELDVWPVQSVTSVTYSDTLTTTTTISSDLLSQPIGTGKYSLRLKGYQSWPSSAYTPNAVSIQFVAGFASRNDIPPVLVRAMLMLISHWFENREATVVGSVSSEVAFGVNSLIEMVRPGEDYLE